MAKRFSVENLILIVHLINCSLFENAYGNAMAFYGIRKRETIQRVSICRFVYLLIRAATQWKISE